MKHLTMSAICLISLTGCATVLTGTNQSIEMTAIDRQNHEELRDASCTLKSMNGTVYPVRSNPGTVVVSKNKDPLQVECHQAGYENYMGAINSSFNPVTLLDILFWPTFFVDYGTGAMQKYPSVHTVEMKKAKDA